MKTHAIKSNARNLAIGAKVCDNQHPPDGNGRKNESCAKTSFPPNFHFSITFLKIHPRFKRDIVPMLQSTSGCRDPYNTEGASFGGSRWCEIFAGKAFCKFKCMLDCDMFPVTSAFCNEPVCGKGPMKKFASSIMLSCQCTGVKFGSSGSSSCSTGTYSWADVESMHSEFCSGTDPWSRFPQNRRPGAGTTTALITISSMTATSSATSIASNRMASATTTRASSQDDDSHKSNARKFANRGNQDYEYTYVHDDSSSGNRGDRNHRIHNSNLVIFGGGHNESDGNSLKKMFDVIDKLRGNNPVKK
uniref:Uncharacterized protein n=1 Tax=Romanomermis culicivorax TaxID=13658 RepID=A0A915KYK6_ROMCU